VLDSDGFRANVAMIVCNRLGKLLWTKRIGNDGWQFPQGGMQPGESPEQAMYRELREEVGLCAADVSVLGESQGWLRYRLPKRLIRRGLHRPEAEMVPARPGKRRQSHSARSCTDSRIR